MEERAGPTLHTAEKTVSTSFSGRRRERQASARLSRMSTRRTSRCDSPLLLRLMPLLVATRSASMASSAFSRPLHPVHSTLLAPPYLSGLFEPKFC